MQANKKMSSEIFQYLMNADPVQQLYKMQVEVSAEPWFHAKTRSVWPSLRVKIAKNSRWVSDHWQLLLSELVDHHEQLSASTNAKRGGEKGSGEV